MQRFVVVSLFIGNEIYYSNYRHLQVTKGREQLEEARRTYEILNTELHDELPALHDSRILFLVTNLQTLFASEQVFHSETAKVYLHLVHSSIKSTEIKINFFFF